jgi:hypothetical protein
MDAAPGTRIIWAVTEIKKRRFPRAAPFLIQLILILFLVVFRLAFGGRATRPGLILVEGMRSQEQVVGGLAGALLSVFLGSPFIIAGGLKIVYDLILFRCFKASQGVRRV